MGPWPLFVFRFRAFFPVSVRTQGSLLAFGRAEGPKGVWGWDWVSEGVGGLFARILRVSEGVCGLFARILRGFQHSAVYLLVFYEVFRMVPPQAHACLYFGQ